MQLVAAAFGNMFHAAVSSVGHVNITKINYTEAHNFFA